MDLLTQEKWRQQEGSEQKPGNANISEAEEGRPGQGGREVREDQEKVPDMQSFSEGATGVAGSSREVRQARVGLVVRNLTPLIGDHRWGFTQGAWCSREPVPQTVPFPVTC